MIVLSVMIYCPVEQAHILSSKRYVCFVTGRKSDETESPDYAPSILNFSTIDKRISHQKMCTLKRAQQQQQLNTGADV